LAERFKLAEIPDAADQIVRDMLKTSESPFTGTRVLTFLLKLVAINGTEDAARLLLQRGAEIHGGIIANSIYHNQVSVLQVVIDASWDVNTPIKYQGDALAIAIHYNKADVVRLLLNSGAHPRENEGSQGNTTLGDAAVTVRGSPDIISMLIESGVEIKESRALELAARAGRKDNVLCLLEKGADVDEVPDIEWWYVSKKHREEGLGSALHAAASQGHSEIVSLLVEKGADIYLEDSLGRTALRRAVLGMHPYAAAVLSKAILWSM